MRGRTKLLVTGCVLVGCATAVVVSPAGGAIVETTGPGQDVDEARRLMAEHQLDRLVVAQEDGHLVGIISEADIREDEAPLA